MQRRLTTARTQRKTRANLFERMATDDNPASARRSSSPDASNRLPVDPGSAGPVSETGPSGAESPSRPDFPAILLFLLVARLFSAAVKAETWPVAGG
jgi:hypothetical protein